MPCIDALDKHRNSIKMEIRTANVPKIIEIADGKAR
jgi:hypothetical protein